MPITLPYSFDTSKVWRIILKKGIVFLLVFFAGIVYSLLVRHFGAALQLTLSSALLLWFGHIFFKTYGGSIGTVTENAVIVRPTEVYRLQLPGPSGEFSLKRFGGVRVERVSAPILVGIPSGGPFQRVYLVGDATTPSIMIARENGDSQVGQEIARLVSLPCEQVNALY
jgi:hypothetical protein